jgi:hypothetical protein
MWFKSPTVSDNKALKLDLSQGTKAPATSFKMMNYSTVNFRFPTCTIIVNNFYYPTNALNYTKLKRLKSTLYKSLKGTKLKITPTCFGSYVIHHQGVQSCAWLKFLVVVHRYFVMCLVGVWQRNFEPVGCEAGRTVHTHHRFKITLPNTDQAHDKISVNHYE